MAQEKKKLTDEEKNPSNFFSSPVGHIRDRIIIHESLRIPKAGQFISLNGYAFLAKPGVEIDIPRPVRLMLDTLTESEVIVGEDEKTYTRDIPRFTYRLIAEGVNVPSAAVLPASDGWKDDKPAAPEV